MIFVRLALENFCCFRERIECEFPTMPGLYFMHGENLVEDIGANGVGKTRFWDGFCWVLKGRTTRNQKGPALLPWGGSGTVRGELVLRPRRVNHTITRTWQPIQLLLDDEPIEQQQLDGLLRGLSADALLNSILISQFPPQKFLDQPSGEQSRLLSNVLSLERWLERSRDASKQADYYDGISRSAAEAISEKRGRLAESKSKDFNAAAREWDTDRRQRLADMRREEQDASKRIRSIRRKRKCLKRSVAKHDKAFRTVERRLVNLRKRMDDTLRAKERAASKRDHLHGEIAAVESEQQKFKDLANQKRCPLCGSRLSAKHLQDERSRLHTKIQGLQSRLEKADREYSRWRRALNSMEGTWRTLQNQRESIQHKVLSLDATLDSLKNKGTVEDRASARLRRDRSRLESEVNPFRKAAEEARGERRRLISGLASLRRLAYVLERREDAYRYWTKAFKEVRLMIIRESLTQLELETNAALGQLGLDGWSMSFDVERETKSGSISKGFHIEVQSPHNKKPVAWESWSGGQSQRLRLSAVMGMADMITARHGLSPNLEVWDEPSIWLSDRGIDDLLAALESRAHEQQKQVWLVDHRDLQYRGFAGRLDLVFDDRGSHIR